MTIMQNSIQQTVETDRNYPMGSLNTVRGMLCAPGGMVEVGALVSACDWLSASSPVKFALSKRSTNKSAKETPL